MRIFWTFMVLLCDAFLWLVPVSDLVYDFRTDPRIDTFAIDTAVGETTANMVLQKYIYDNDTSTLSYLSDLPTDMPTYVSYNATTRLLNLSGFTDNASRSLDVQYDTEAVAISGAWATIIDTLLVPLWYVLIVVFPLAGFVYLFWEKIARWF